MTQDYSELLKRYSDKSSRGEATDMGGDMAFAIRALVEENERQRSVLASLIDAYEAHDVSAHCQLNVNHELIEKARAILGKTK